MTRAKLVGRILFWAFRLSLLLLGPLLVLLAFCLIILLPTQPLILACIVTSLLAIAYLYYGLTCDLAFPIPHRQTDSPGLKKGSISCFVTSCCFFFACIALYWLHSAPARGNDMVGLRLFFIHEDALFVLFLLGVTCHATMLFLLIKAIVKNVRQFRFQAWLLVIATGLYPVAGVVMLLIGGTKIPEWQRERNIDGPDKQIYAYLENKRFFREPRLTALARQTASNPFFDTVEIVLIDTQPLDAQSALEQGVKHKDAAIREVCTALRQLGYY